MMKKWTQIPVLLAGNKNSLSKAYLFAALLSAGLVLGNSALAELRYTITDLGTLGGITSIGTGINASGQVTGSTDTKMVTNDRKPHAFITNSSGQMTDLAPLSILSAGLGINASGQVTGYYWGSSHHAFVTNSSGKLIDLGTLLQGSKVSTSEGNGINDSRQVTGYSYDNGNYHAFVTSPNGQMSDLGTLGGRHSFGYGINNAGQVTGFAMTITGSGHAFITGSSGQLIDLGVLPGGIASIGRGINASGQVTGGATVAGGKSHAFVTNSSGQMIDLGTLRNGYHTIGIGINTSGQVVGFDSPDNPLNTGSLITTSSLGKIAFVTDNGIMKNINALISGANAANWRLTVAYAINDAGQITGAGYNNNGNIFSDGVLHAILLTPVGAPPPPPTPIQNSVSPINLGSSTPDCPKACDGNPINAATGNKFQAETDFVGTPGTGLEMRRFYNSQNSL